jgi:Ca2+-binding EF-hand superfamily protein
MLFPWALAQALSKTLTEDDLVYLKEQFALLKPNKNGTISFENIQAVGFLLHILFITAIKMKVFIISQV